MLWFYYSISKNLLICGKVRKYNFICSILISFIFRSTIIKKQTGWIAEKKARKKSNGFNRTVQVSNCWQILVLIDEVSIIKANEKEQMF